MDSGEHDDPGAPRGNNRVRDDVPSMPAAARVNSAKTHVPKIGNGELPTGIEVTRDPHAAGMASDTRCQLEKGESIVLRRCVTLAVSCCLVLALGLLPVDLLFAQTTPRK